MDAMGGIRTDDSWRRKERETGTVLNSCRGGYARPSYLGALKSANVRESALGVSGTASTQTPISSCR